MPAKMPKHGAKWILCTKWHELKEDAKDPKKKTLIFFWTPIGDRQEFVRRGVYSRIFEYDTFEEAKEDLRRIINIKMDTKHEEVQNLVYCACQVRYVPKKMKVYKKEWFNKYVIKEMGLAAKDNAKPDLSPK